MLPLLQQIGDGILDPICDIWSRLSKSLRCCAVQKKNAVTGFNEYKTEMRNQLLEQYSAENERLTGSGRVDQIDRSK